MKPHASFLGLAMAQVVSDCHPYHIGPIGFHTVPHDVYGELSGTGICLCPSTSGFH
jgi:hypothetical protein